jgi:hypothetical protein
VSINKTFLFGFISAVIIFVIVGCSSLVGKNKGTIGKASQKQSSQKEKILALEQKVSTNSEQRLTKIGAWAEGSQYALGKVPEPSKEVIVAKTVNDRIVALANKPDFKEVQEVKNIIDALLSEQKEGERLLAQKDKEISRLNSDVQSLQTAKQSEVNKALKLAGDSAAQADQFRETLNDLEGNWGLNSIFYGVKKLFLRLTWVLCIGSVLFIILRLLAGSNPMAGAVFHLFEQVVSWLFVAIKALFPKAHSIAGLTETKTFNDYRQTLVHLVDSIQLLKEKSANGQTYSIDDLLNEVSKLMDREDKERIEVIKRSLNWS